VPVRLIAGDEPLPPPESADARGLVAVGGDLSPVRLLDGYRRGIFPWYEEGLPILWHSPDPRFVLRPEGLMVNRSLRKTIRRAPFEISFDRAFKQVIQACAGVPRAGQDGTWITQDMVAAYCELHELGHAHSVEAWSDGLLVGGLYGVQVGAVFCGESMFSVTGDASKVAFVHLVRQLRRWGFALVDCQVHTEHLERFGALEWPRDRFLARLAELRDQQPEVARPWRFDEDLDPLAE
jgi:leucyl/phenylalanyl-tRNA--protein transferase